MGIIVTTIIMSVSCVMHNNNLSDQEIIEKAIELGMIMPDSEKESESGLLGSGDKNSSDSVESETEGEPQSGSEVTSEPSETELPSETDMTTENEEPTQPEGPTEPETPTESETDEPVTQQPPQHVETTQYILHIVWGDYPRKIANELYENGMIDSAKEFRDYLGDFCKKNNKDIRVGSYTITKGMTYEEIAKIITKTLAN